MARRSARAGLSAGRHAAPDRIPTAAPGAKEPPRAAPASPAGRTRHISLLALGMLALAACDVPTEAPRWNTEWAIPVPGTTMSVASLLPTSVGVTEDTSAFVLSLDSVRAQATLREACPECALADGFTVPKPGFDYTFTSEIGLPDEVVSAAVTGGGVIVELTNGFNFDPIRPSSAADGETGLIAVTVRHGGVVLAADTLDGAEVDFKPGAARQLVLDFTPTTLTDTIEFATRIYSPQGDSVTIDADLAFAAASLPSEVLVGEAEVVLGPKSVEVDAVTLDFTEDDEALSDYAQGGALLLEIANPFAVAGTMELHIDTPDGVIEDTLAVEPEQTTTPRVELSAEDLRSILGGGDVTLGATGTVSAPSGTVTLRPAQALTVASTLELVIGPTEE